MVQCKEGIHNETYKIFANLFNFADISYMDPNVFKNCPYIKVNGLKMTHILCLQILTEFMLIQ